MKIHKLKTILVLFVMCVLVLSIGCSRYYSLENVEFDQENMIFRSHPDKETVTEHDRQILENMNDAILFAPTLGNILSGKDGYSKFVSSYDNFMENNYKLIATVEPGIDQSALIYSFIIGYAASIAIIKDVNYIEPETKKILEEYSGSGYEELVLIHSFMASLYYCNNDSFSVPFQGDKLLSGLDTAPGIVQIAKSYIMFSGITAEYSMNKYDKINDIALGIQNSATNRIDNETTSAELKRLDNFNRFQDNYLYYRYTSRICTYHTDNNSALLYGHIYTASLDMILHICGMAEEVGRRSLCLNPITDNFISKVISGDADSDIYRWWENNLND